MAAKFVTIDRDTPLLLPPDLRDWVGSDHLAHFIIDAVDALDLRAARVNQRGTGSAQYPPAMMLALLIYSYATGAFSSRRIEQQTYENVAVRLLCADTHPDHDSLCKFRRENKDLLAGSFHQVLELAAEARVLKVGDLTVAIDGTKVLAHASKHSAMSHEHIEKQMKLAAEQIGELLAKAEQADSVPLRDGLSISDAPNDKEQLQPTLAAVSPVVASVSAALVDSGFYSEEAVTAVERGGHGPKVDAATKRHGRGRRVRQLEERPDPPAPPAGAPVAEVMAHRLETQAGKDLYARRKQTVEPVFGMIKEAMGFRRFMLRGLEKVSAEWTLVTTACNLKRLFNLGLKIARA